MASRASLEPKNLKQRLADLGEFAPLFEAEGFKFSEMRGGDEIDPGVFSMPWSDFSETATEFLDRCYADGWVLSEFNWMEWVKTPEATLLSELPGVKLLEASPEQLARLLTALVRNDRFCEGCLQDAFDSGLLLAILRRAGDLASSV